ncbi:MAG: peptidase M28, partial [Dehalococcoidia bacterium]|nr:peptidase M28 [Dehalococcoidia bacterium]
MWEQIRANQIRSTLVVFFMGVLLVLLGAAIGSYFVDSAEVGIGFALILWFILNLVALFQGDDIMLSLGHAKKVTKQEFPRLFNVVEEMSIASGLPVVPAVYVVDDPTPNAFAT